MPLRIDVMAYGQSSHRERPPSIFSVLTALILVGAIIPGVPRPAIAQDSTHTIPTGTVPREPVSVRAVDGADIRFGALAQMDLHVRGNEEPSGFDIRAARLRTSIRSHGFDAFLQTEFVRSPAVFDLRLRYRPHPQVRLTAGLFKSPFSRSHLTSRPVLPLAERPIPVDAIAPRRQIGAAVRMQDASGTVGLETGIFNGNGREIQPNDNEHFLYVTRLAGTRNTSVGTVEVGINGAYSIDDEVRLQDLSDTPFTGERAVAGADVEVRNRLWFVSGEALAVRLSRDGTGGDIPGDVRGGAKQTGAGGYVAGGVPLPWFGDGQTVQAVARYEQFDPNLDVEDGWDLSRLSAGLNVRPTETLLLQWTGVLPLRERPGDLDGPYMTLRLQLALR